MPPSEELHPIEEVFGEGCDLYKLLKCNADATKAQLRKGYYRAALKVSIPDKNTANGTTDTTKEFQAISMAYEILQDETLRQEYNETGVIPDKNDDIDHDDMTNGRDAWKSYFDRIFGKVTTSKIDSFAQQYKCSDEERRDVLREFQSQKGNLKRMLDFVMLSEPRDALRWVEDYIRPALYSSDDDDTATSTSKERKAAAAWKTTMEKTLAKLQKQVEKENQKQQKAAAASAQKQQDDDDGDSSMDEEETETEDEEEDDEEEETPQKKKSSSNKKTARNSNGSSKSPNKAAKKGKPSQAKHHAANKKHKTSSSNNKKKQGGSSMDDLIMQIQNKRRGGGASGGSAWADLGARYGVANDDDDDDPLNDEEFAKIQAGLDKKKKSKVGRSGR